MAFIQALRRKAIRFKVVVLDDTPLPLYLEPFQVFSVRGSARPAADILLKLKPLLREPARSVRSKFVNRHDEIEKIEAAVDDPEFHAVWAFGFVGVGKSSTIEEALQRIFKGSNIVRANVGAGTGLVELALSLSASALRQPLEVGLSQGQLEDRIRLCLETIVKNGQLLFLSNVQHWLDEEGQPQGPLPFILSIVADLKAFSGLPVFLTSTRRPRIDPQIQQRLMIFNVPGLKDEHVGALVRNWYFAIYDKELTKEESNRLAPKLYGHPVAARLVAGILGNTTADFLEQYPQELIALRRDLARVLLQDLQLSTPAENLMETLALAGVGLPPSVLVAAGSNEEEFQQAVAQCARAGLITADKVIETHPLFQDFYWHRLHRGDYKHRAVMLAEAIRARIASADKASPEFASLLPVLFRSYALSGDLGKAIDLRRDLVGELEATAITLYNRRDYELADKYISHALDADARNWRMRLYQGRIRIRQERWQEADKIFSAMLDERRNDVGVLHAMAWSQLRQRNWAKALSLFTGIIARREHVASLRDAAECLHRLKRDEEALQFLMRAKERESENPFVLDLESRILEDMGRLDAAYDSAELASARDPLNERLHHRLGVIRVKQGKPQLAIDHFEAAIELDPAQFSPANSLAAAYLDVDEWELAEQLLPELEKKARTPSDFAVLTHTTARVAFAKRDLAQSKQLLKTEIAGSRNVIPSLGLLIQVLCASFDDNIQAFPAIASVELTEADNALKRILDIDPSNALIESFERAVRERQSRQRPIRHR